MAPHEIPCADDPSWEQRAIRATQGLKIISTQAYKNAPLWVRIVEPVCAVVAAKPGFWVRLWARAGVPDPSLIWRLIGRARHADVVLLYGGERADLIYLCLAAALPWIRVPHVIIDVHWQPSTVAWKRGLQRLCVRLGMRALAQAQVHSTEEFALYARHFELAHSVMVAVPWSSSVRGYFSGDLPRPTQRQGVVSGGLSYRDYPRLIDAARNLRLPLHLGIPASLEADHALCLAEGANTISIGTDWANTAFWHRVAHADVFALPFEPGLTRATGDQTLLTAMALGAIVVATDSITTRLYVRHGVNGFVVPVGDELGWERVLTRVAALPPQERDAIRDAARDDGLRVFSEERRIVCTLEHAAAHAHAWRDRSGKAAPMWSHPVSWVLGSIVMAIGTAAAWL